MVAAAAVDLQMRGFESLLADVNRRARNCNIAGPSGAVLRFQRACAASRRARQSKCSAVSSPRLASAGQRPFTSAFAVSAPLNTRSGRNSRNAGASAASAGAAISTDQRSPVPSADRASSSPRSAKRLSAAAIEAAASLLRARRRRTAGLAASGTPASWLSWTLACALPRHAASHGVRPAPVRRVFGQQQIEASVAVQPRRAPLSRAGSDRRFGLTLTSVASPRTCHAAGMPGARRAWP